jgi:hypothetical protein
MAGLALGCLAYKPPLGLAVAFVFLGAAEWRVAGGAFLSACTQLLVGLLYWGPSILRPYVASLVRFAETAPAIEAYTFQMHSWRAFFGLTGLPASVAFAMYVVASVCTAVVALRCWRSPGPLALRFSVLLIATILIDPHAYAYDLIVLIPALMLLWDWSLAEPSGHTFTRRFQALLYFCYFSPLFSPLADAAGIQLSVVAMAVLGAIVAGVLLSSSREAFGRLVPA